MDLVGHRFEQMLQELPCCFTIGLLDELRDRKRAGSVDSNKQIELAFLSPDFGNADMEITDRVSLELLSLGFIAFDVW